ncbi:MAG: hypothetical protein JNM66_14470 [Bryobacterales bacterium]|nr:hypothetical protein [Bryobacterales bacterium]
MRAVGSIPIPAFAAANILGVRRSEIRRAIETGDLANTTPAGIATYIEQTAKADAESHQEAAA